MSEAVFFRSAFSKKPTAAGQMTQKGWSSWKVYHREVPIPKSYNQQNRLGAEWFELVSEWLGLSTEI